jgi:hypothetical protein
MHDSDRYLNDAVLPVPHIAVTFVFTNLDKELTIK